MKRLGALVVVAAIGCTPNPGPQGPQGAQGATGNPGDVGPRGATGATGASGLDGVSGALGATGPAGATGAVGPTGAVGATGAVLFIQVADGGTVTIDGGVIVVTGPQGATGLAGQSVVASSASGSDCPHGGVRYESASGTAFVCNGAPGVTGAIGVTGALGPTGTAGPTGTSGTNGVTGATGTTGPTGAVGPIGGAKIVQSDGGVYGYLTGADVWAVGAQCLVSVSMSFAQANTVMFDGPNCTGVAYLPNTGLSLPPSSAADARGRCFAYAGAPSNTFGRLARPIRKVTFDQQSTASVFGPTCTNASLAAQQGYQVVPVDADGLGPFPPEPWDLFPPGE